MINKLLKLLLNIPIDKLLHCYIGYIISDIVISITNNMELSIPISCVCGISITIIFAILKEWYDKNKANNKPDIVDILSTVAGGITKNIIYLIFI